MSVVTGCEDCRRTSSAGGCPKHSSATYSPGVYEAAMLAHRHRWVYDGLAPGGSSHLIFHCDDHDPPIARVVVPAREAKP